MNACRSPTGMLSGVWLIWMGADQVNPPSVDIENAMPVYWKLLKRASCQTAYRLPLVASTATSKTQLIVRMPGPPSGLGTPRDPGTVSVSCNGRMSATGMGALAGSQVSPWSDERIKEI